MPGVRGGGPEGKLRTYSDTLWTPQSALDSAGIIFIAEADGLGAGVRLARPV